jgi:hypothetical protein
MISARSEVRKPSQSFNHNPGARSCQKSSKSSKLCFTCLSPARAIHRLIAVRRPSSPPDGGGWFSRLARSALSFLRCDGPTEAPLGEAKYNIKYMAYWFDAQRGTGFCLVDAPDADTAEQVHREAHGQVASSIIPVDLDAVEAFLGRISDPHAQANIERHRGVGGRARALWRGHRSVRAARGAAAQGLCRKSPSVPVRMAGLKYRHIAALRPWDSESTAPHFA